MTRPYGDDVLVVDRELCDAEQSVADQHAYIRRMIMHGAPTQAAEDQLRQRELKLVGLRAAQRRSKVGG